MSQHRFPSDSIKCVLCGSIGIFDNADPCVPTERLARLVNAEPEIVAALEAAEDMLHHCSGPRAVNAALATVRAALAKVRP